MSFRRNQKLVIEENSMYKGNTKNGVPHGKGQLSTPLSIFKGKWKNGKIEGKGKIEICMDHLFFIGGDSPLDEKHPFSTFFIMNKEREIYSLPPCSLGRSVGKLMCVEHYLYFIGGFNGTRVVPNVERFDLFQNRWEPMCSLIERRASFDSFLYNSKIYVFGGVMGSIVHNTMEEYNHKENKWTLFASLRYGRSSCLVHLWKDKCYILGGIGSTLGGLPLEIFNMTTKKSYVEENIIINSHGSGSILIEIDEKPFILIVGGKYKDKLLNDVYSYSIEENILKKMSPLCIERMYCSLVFFNNNLYCIGGYNKEKNAILPFEKYNFKTDEWELLPNPIKHPISGTSFLSIENQKISLEGKWKDGILHGKTTIQMNEKKIEGMYKEGKKEGFFGDIYYRKNIPVSYQEILWEEKVKKIKNIPDNFKCPISLEVMIDPVILESGITFDKKNIEEWFLHHNTCPLTRNVVNKKCIPNKIIRTMIYEFIEKKGIRKSNL